MSRQVRHLYEFGPFRLDPEKPCLWRDGEPVALTPKAVETLLILVQQNGKLVEREALINAIWPDTFVEEGNLNFNVSVLRKALGTDEAGEQYIQTIPKHGYRFRAEVREVTEDVPTLVVEKHTRAQVVIEERDLPADVEVDRIKTTAALTRTSPAGLLVTARRGHLPLVLVGVVLLGLVGAVVWLLASRQSTANQSGTDVGGTPRSIAVLPLKPLRNDESDRTLSVALTDTLVTRLGSLKSIIVRPISTSYGAGQRDPVEIGRELKVDAVLEATLQRINNQLRVNARLLRVIDGALLWSASFNEKETDLFLLQDALAVQLTESLTSTLNPQQRELLTKRDTQNREAFHAYWRGRVLLQKRAPEKAISEFQRAMSLDPNYVLAYTGLADAYSWQANFSSDADSELYEKARDLANKAVKLDPNLADAHTSLARVQYSHDWDWEGAEKSFRRALELDPNNVNAHQFYARLLATLGRYEAAIAEIEKARELDPRNVDLAVPLFAVMEKRGQYDQALNVLQTALEIEKDSQIAQRAVGKIYLIKGDYAKVIELGSRHFPNPGQTDFAWASMLATAYHRTGQDSKALAMQSRLKKLAENDSKALYFLVMHYGEIGRKDEALAALQKCLELREERMIWTKDEPRFAAIKDEPRFREILHKLNLPT